MLMTDEGASGIATSPLVAGAQHAHECLRVCHQLVIAHVPCPFSFLSDHSFSFSRSFIHGSGWWNGSGIRRRAVEASRTHLKSSRSVSIAPLATLRSACQHSFARGLGLSSNRSKSVGSQRSSSNTSASVALSQPENRLFQIKTSANARSHVVNLRCGGRSGVKPGINTEFQARKTQGICKLFTEMQRGTWIPEHRVSQ